jgi:hypothetical protein
VEETSKNKTKKEQSEMAIACVSQIIEVRIFQLLFSNIRHDYACDYVLNTKMITLRHRLLTSLMETEILAKMYPKIAEEMGFEEFHMYLRYVQFDFAMHKENAGAPPPLLVSELNPEETQLDRYVSANLYLAIHELEEGQIGRLSFKGKENIQQVSLLYFILSCFNSILFIFMFQFEDSKTRRITKPQVDPKIATYSQQFVD